MAGSILFRVLEDEGPPVVYWNDRDSGLAELAGVGQRISRADQFGACPVEQQRHVKPNVAHLSRIGIPGLAGVRCSCCPASRARVNRGGVGGSTKSRAIGGR